MTKTDIAKKTVSLIVGIGTVKVVKQVIKNNTTSESATDKAAILVAGYILGAIAADASKMWTDDKIDDIVIWWTEVVVPKFS